MKKITVKDLQELFRLLKKAKCRPMTEQEIAAFKVIPEGATHYQDLKSLRAACQTLNDRRVHYQSGCYTSEGIFWTFEVIKDGS